MSLLRYYSRISSIDLEPITRDNTRDDRIFRGTREHRLKVSRLTELARGTAGRAGCMKAALWKGIGKWKSVTEWRLRAPPSPSLSFALLGGKGGKGPSPPPPGMFVRSWNGV